MCEKRTEDYQRLNPELGMRDCERSREIDRRRDVKIPCSRSQMMDMSKKEEVIECVKFFWEVK